VQLRDREAALFEDGDHRLADQTGGADHGDSELSVHALQAGATINRAAPR
jgi:hypothetical protein